MSAVALPWREQCAGVSVDWPLVLHRVFLSRALDALEETRLFPAHRVLFQFAARGHDVTQALLAQQLTGQLDAVAAYYRSRPLVLSLGLSLDDAIASNMMRSGSMTEGRDAGMIYNLPRRDGPCVLPGAGGVGAQYTPAVGWAQALRYREQQLGDAACSGSIAVAHGGEASLASNGFWSALNIAAAQRLPVLFFVEDNGYGISVPATLQTPTGNFASNLASFHDLSIFDGDAARPLAAASLIRHAVAAVRNGAGPALLRLSVPRLCGHSGQDTQAYRSAAELAAESARDPLAGLRRELVPQILSDEAWHRLEQRAREEVEAALARVEQRGLPEKSTVTRFLFAEQREDGSPEVQRQGGLLPEGMVLPAGHMQPRPEGTRINMLAAIRRTLGHELEVNPRMLIFGEDVGAKGGVHGATLGLQEKFGTARVFDTSLSEEGIIGRAIGMALAGLLPVPEIQFRKYAEPATEQLNSCGTIRWRTANRFAAPLVVRMPGGFFKCGDPWHSQSNEVQFVHAIGWRVAMPSNAEDAAGLLRAALRGNDPVIFFEHRALLDAAWARRPWPGDDFVLPFGLARRIRAGQALTVVSWGAMVERCERAAEQASIDADILDLRTLSPWDRNAVLESVRRTHRCLIVHEDNATAGFGAEIAAVLARDAFFDLDAPIERLTMPDVPVPHSPELMDAVVPTTERIALALRDLASV